MKKISAYSFTRINLMPTSKLFPFYSPRGVLAGGLFLLCVFWIFTTFNTSSKNQIPIKSKEDPELSRRIDQQCMMLERLYLEKPQRLIFQSYMTHVENTGMELKQRLISKTLKFFPMLKQMWCLVPQSGEETWEALVVAKISNLGPESPPTSSPGIVTLPTSAAVSSRKVRQAYLRAIMSESIRKILLTRHPFARITEYFNKHVRNKTGKVVNKLLKEGKSPNFPQFVDYLLSRSDESYPDEIRPIFQLCGLCDIKYDRVLRYEDMNRTRTPTLKSHDTGMSRENMDEALQEPITFPSDISFQKHTFQMYLGIARPKLLLLYNIYKMDFQLLHYSFYDVVQDFRD